MSVLAVITTQQYAAPAGRTVVVRASGNGMAFDLDPRGS
jgi:hypothetical protein